MKTTAYTPGPWGVDLVLGLPKVTSDPRKAPVRIIADVHVDGGIAALKKSAALRNEIAANARLISSAPSLLESLNELIAITDRKHDAWDRAKAALEKAKGGAR